jgi:hypothetical protein
MASPAVISKIAKVTALSSAILVIPVLAYIGLVFGHENLNAGAEHGRPIVSTVPEANTGLVLIPFFGAVLLFSSLHMARAKSARKDGIQ